MNFTSSSSEGGSEEPPSSSPKVGVIAAQKGPKIAGSFFIRLAELPANIQDFCRKIEPELLEALEFETIKNIDRCYQLWQEFSLKKTLFDCWEFRLAFYKGYKFEPYFIVIKNKRENLALLALEHDMDENRYTWFGSPWQEENKFYVKNPMFIPMLLALAPKPLYLNAIEVSNIIPVKDFIDLQPDYPKYILNIKNFKTSDDFLALLSKNKRHGLRKDKRRIEKQTPNIVIDNFSELDNLIDISKHRFEGKGEEADWLDPRRIETFRQVIKSANVSYGLRMISIYVQGKPAGVDLIALFNGTYYALKCGYNVKEFPGIGNFMNLFEIDDALSLGAWKIDFLQNNYEWKDRFFQAIPLLKCSIPPDKTDQIILRPFKINDLRRICDIENASFTPIDAYSKNRLERLSQEYGDNFIVAEKGGFILGYVIAYEDKGLLDIYSIAVDPKYRNLGIASMMLKERIEHFKKKGIHKSSLEVRPTNTASVSFFQKFGYKMTDTIKNYYNDSGSALKMERKI